MKTLIVEERHNIIKEQLILLRAGTNALYPVSILEAMYQLNQILINVNNKANLGGDK